MRSIRPIRALATAALLTCTLQTAAAAAAPPAASAANDAAETAARLDINTASEKDFEALPNVGPSRAQAIVKTRSRMKRFRRIEDLMRVRGIGRKTFRQLRPLITVNATKARAGQAGRE